MYRAHATPTSAKSLSTVFFATPVMRQVALIPTPSTSAFSTRTRVSVAVPAESFPTRVKLNHYQNSLACPVRTSPGMPMIPAAGPPPGLG
jgi:hypothetical protein